MTEEELAELFRSEHTVEICGTEISRDEHPVTGVTYSALFEASCPSVLGYKIIEAGIAIYSLRARYDQAIDGPKNEGDDDA